MRGRRAKCLPALCAWVITYVPDHVVLRGAQDKPTCLVHGVQIVACGRFDTRVAVRTVNVHPFTILGAVEREIDEVVEPTLVGGKVTVYHATKFTVKVVTVLTVGPVVFSAVYQVAIIGLATRSAEQIPYFIICQVIMSQLVVQGGEFAVRERPARNQHAVIGRGEDLTEGFIHVTSRRCCIAEPITIVHHVKVGDLLYRERQYIYPPTHDTCTNKNNKN